MKLSPTWLRDFVDLKVDNRRLGDDLTNVGAAVEGSSGAGEDMVFEMEITTNRPDEMNHYGIAREASAIYDVPLNPIAPNLPAPQGKTDFAIKIEDKEGCARYTARVLRGVKIKDSPANIVRRLELVDQRAINNAADASNYTLWEMGHPTHAFDLDLLKGGKITVRRARDGEALKTLDGVDRKLSSEDMVIADAARPVALAGVMGGFDTMITAKTRNILIESAWFDPVSVRKSSKRHGLHTDASHRFERGADYGATSLACARVAQRIIESSGGQLQGDEIDTIARRLDQAPVELRMSEVCRILGDCVSPAQVARILEKLGFDLASERNDAAEFTVHIPSWRLDVEREIDLIEEIARLHGYDKFPNTLPSYSGAVVDMADAGKDGKLRSSLLALGYDEAVSLTFISSEDAARFSPMPTLELANPVSEEAPVMRSSMVPGMLDMIAHNLNRDSNSVKLFETGNVFEASGTKSAELKRICLGAAGSAVAAGVHQPERPVSFFDLKGDVETLLSAFQHDTLSYDTNTADYYRAGRAARAVMDGSTVAQFGQIHADAAAARKLRQEVWIAEIYLDRLYTHGLREIRYQALPKYPAVDRDFSFSFADSVAFEKIDQAVKGLGLGELRDFVPVEIFRGGAVPAGKYSMLLRATFQSSERTLREDEIARWCAQIVKALEALGGVLRAF